MMKLIIACGNRLREDDGAGLILARRLVDVWVNSGRSVDYQEVHQLVPELAPLVADPAIEEVWFVDTRLAIDEPNPALHFWPLGATVPTPSVTHQMGPEMILYLAETLYGRRPPAWQITVPGFSFEHREGLSRRCHLVMAEALDDMFALQGAQPHA